MDSDDSDFLSAFEACTLPRSEWTHRAHVRMGYLYLRDGPDADRVLPLVRERIRSYNQANRNRTGYHETITASFLRLIADRLRREAAADFSSFERANGDLFAPRAGALKRYFTDALLFSREARAHCIAPDIEPLP